MMIAASWCLAAYLIGSISWSWLLVRRMTGTDLRTVGSGNLGATNAGRVLGRKWAVGIYLLDLAKGAIAVIGARFIGGQLGGVPLELVAGAAAMLGHMFPFYLRFKGGKGVATGSGIVFALAPWTGLGGIAVWLVTVKLSRMVSLASILAAVSLPVFHQVLPHRGGHDWRMRFLIAIAVLVVVMHRSNIARIAAGTENRIGSKT